MTQASAVKNHQGDRIGQANEVVSFSLVEVEVQLAEQVYNNGEDKGDG